MVRFLQGTGRLAVLLCPMTWGEQQVVATLGMYPVPSERGCLTSLLLSLSLSLSAIFGLVYRPRDFASYILGIFICNLLLYLAFYIIMKVKEAAVAVHGVPVSKREGMGLFFWLQSGFLWCCRGMWSGRCGAQGGKRFWCWGRMLCSHLGGGWSVFP